MFIIPSGTSAPLGGEAKDPLGGDATAFRGEKLKLSSALSEMELDLVFSFCRCSSFSETPMKISVHVA